jgi:peroxiredoxin
MSGLLQAGDLAPEFTLADVYGKTVRLEQYRGRPVILFFMRHLGCLISRAHLTLIRQQYGKIQHRNGEVLVVSFEEEEGIRRMIAAQKLPFVFLPDPDRETYKQYGMLYRQEGPVQTWKTLLQHIRLRLAGYPRQKRGSDIRQMGGIVIIDSGGTIRYIHRSLYPEDLPGIDQIMEHFA